MITITAKNNKRKLGTINQKLLFKLNINLVDAT